MKERPILFSAPMVRAILAGTKTQTRRVVKPQPPSEVTSAGVMSAPGRGYDGEWSWLSGDPKDCDSWGFVGEEFRCPYGQPGDRLWVRETFYHHGACACYRADGWTDAPDVGYQVTPAPKWTPSIHMPRWASRILLEIFSVRVERLQAISDADSVAEGISCYPFRPDDGFPVCDGFTYRENDGKCGLWPKAAQAYRELWESINGPGSWDANPWVWVVEFKRVTT